MPLYKQKVYILFAMLTLYLLQTECKQMFDIKEVLANDKFLYIRGT